MIFDIALSVFLKRSLGYPTNAIKRAWHLRGQFAALYICAALLLISACSHQPTSTTNKDDVTAKTMSAGQQGELTSSDNSMLQQHSRLDAAIHLTHRIKSDIAATGLTQDNVAIFISPLEPQQLEKNQQHFAFEHHNKHAISSSTILSINAHHPMNPASTMKLVTTASSLGLLELTYQAQTSLWIEPQTKTQTPHILQGPIYLKGQGSATFDRGQLQQLLEQLWLRGYRHIPNGIVFDRGFFQPNREDLTTAPFDETPLALYNLIPDSLLFDEGIQRIMLRSTQRELSVALSPFLHNVSVDTRQVNLIGRCGQWRYPGNLRFQWQMEHHGHTITSHVASHSKVATKNTAISSSEISNQYKAVLHVSGQFPANCQQQVFAPWFNRDDQLALFIAQSWQQLGGTLGESTLGGDSHQVMQNALSRNSAVPADAIQIATLPSIALTEWIRRINKYSDNPLARSLFLTLGQPCLTDLSQGDTRSEIEAAKISSRGCASDRIVQYLSKQGINTSGIVLDNGSGLSRQERISAKQLADVIQMAYQHHTGHEFVASLPIAGMDGTMKRRLSQACLAGRLRLKTGSLRDVTSIAGLYLAKSATPQVIVIMINGNLSNTKARQMIDSWLWQYLSAITPECRVSPS